MKIKKKWGILIVLIIALIIFRILLPTLVKNYVNKVLADLPGYHGSITDVDIALIRGAYVIKGLKLYNNNSTSDVPFIDFPETDISIEWRALFKGRIVSEIYLYNPAIIYVIQDMDEDDSEGEDWTEALTELVPIDINNFVIEGGKMAYVDVEADPTIDLSIRDFAFTAENLRNVRQEEKKLPSPIKGQGVSLGNGNLIIGGKVNLINQIPDADLNVKLEGIALNAFNDVSNEYANLDFESGNVNAYSELALADGFIKGYFKVLMNNVKYHSKEDSFSETLWEGVVAFFQFILKNKKTGNFAVKAPIEGEIESFSVKSWPAIGSIFTNAFIEAFKSEIDDDIEFKDALTTEEEQIDSLGFFQLKKKRQLRKKMREKEKAKEKENEDEVEKKNEKK